MTEQIVGEPAAPTSSNPYVQELLSRPAGSFVFMREVMTLTGLPDTYIRSLVKRNEFPCPVRLDGRRMSFVLGEVIDWQQRVKAERRMPELRPELAEAVKRGGLKRGAQIKAAAQG